MSCLTSARNKKENKNGQASDFRKMESVMTYQLQSPMSARSIQKINFREEEIKKAED